MHGAYRLTPSKTDAGTVEWQDWRIYRGPKTMDINGHYFESSLAHIRKASSTKYEETLINILTQKLGDRGAAEAYRRSYLDSYMIEPKTTGQLNTVTVNTSELCNFKCIMCDVPNNNRKHLETMSLSRISGFLKGAAAMGAQCCMIGSGSEVTLHPEWRGILGEALALFPDTILFTNGSRLTDSDLEFFIERGLTRLFISLDAATNETFLKIRGYDLLEAIETKIFELLRLRSTSRASTPLVRVSFVVQEDNVHEEKLFERKWINVADSVEFQKCVDIADFRDRSFANSLPVLTPDDMIGSPKCHYPFSYISLWADGKLSPCCTSYGRDCNDLSLGYIHETDAVERAILERESLQKAFISKDWSKIPNSCRHCLKNQED